MSAPHPGLVADLRAGPARNPQRGWRACVLAEAEYWRSAAYRLVVVKREVHPGLRSGAEIRRQTDGAGRGLCPDDAGFVVGSSQNSQNRPSASFLQKYEYIWNSHGMRDFRQFAPTRFTPQSSRRFAPQRPNRQTGSNVRKPGEWAPFCTARKAVLAYSRNLS